MKTNLRIRVVATLLATGVVLAGCHTDMWRQPKLVGQEGNEFFRDGMTTRPPVEGAVARNSLRHDDAKYKGRMNGKFVDSLPTTLKLVDKQVNTSTDLEKVIRRGKDRFSIFCTHCHGAAGDGKGMIAQRGINLRKPPASYHTDRLRSMPLGYFYETITHGHGVMFPFNYRVAPDDRWAIAAYIRDLQKAHNVDASTLSDEEKAHLDAPKKADEHAAPQGESH